MILGARVALLASCFIGTIVFDDSPTGVISGKYEKEVDFNFKLEDVKSEDKITNNLKFINKLCESGDAEEYWIDDEHF